MADLLLDVLAKKTDWKYPLLEERPITASSLIPPLITLVDVFGFLKAYPLYGLMRLCPDWTLRATKTWLVLGYRLLRRAKHRLVAERISQWLGVPLDKGQTLAWRWMHHYTRDRCYHLSTLLKKSPTIGDERSLFGLEHLDRALGEERGVLLVSLHSFAIIPAKLLLRRMNYPILTVRASGRSGLGRVGKRWLLPRLLQLHARILAGSEAVALDDPNCALLIARRLREGGMVHLAADAMSNSSVIVPFLNGRMPLSSGVLDLARLCRCPVLPLVAAYTDSGIRIELGAPLGFRYEGTGEECARANLPILVAELERQVRAFPDQWTLWSDC